MPGGRPRTFDEDETLDRATLVFWSRGYERASLPELLEAMGIARQSLYDTFGDKRKLFLRCLERYAGKAACSIAAMSSTPRAIDGLRGAVRAWLNADGAGCTPKPGRGCLVANAAAQFTPEDPDVLAALAAQRDAVEHAFAGAIERAREQGDLPGVADARALARTLVAMQYGAAVLRRLPGSHEMIADVVRQAERMLEAGPRR